MNRNVQYITIGYAALMLAYVSAAQDPPTLTSTPKVGDTTTEANRRVEKVTDLIGREGAGHPF
jgi:hypothetical protein